MPVRAAAGGFVALALLITAPARAQFLPGESRAITLGDSASRDAPVVELAFGPTLQASLGGELGLWRHDRPSGVFRLSVYGLAAFELDTSAWPPNTYLRTILGVTAAFELRPPAWLGGTLEISIGAGGDLPSTLNSTEVPGTSPGDIPFGAGGVFVQPDIAWRRHFGRWVLTTRLDERVDLPSFLLAAGQTTLADVVADTISDALTNEPSADVVLRWCLTDRWQPLLSVHADGLFPIDASAKPGWFVRALLGVGIVGRAGQAIAFLSADAGNGQGLLVNDHEIRFSLGIRYALR